MNDGTGSTGAAEQEDERAADEQIFSEALSLPPNERAAHVLRESRGDRALAGRVLDLLAAHATAGSFLEAPAIRPQGGGASAELREGPGSVIGPYELISELGEGGFGVVYHARQLQPVRRDVALKIIKLGMDTRQVIARFEAERQALAVLDHPHIARVLDAGSTSTGRPYFVMELVEGVDIAKYCDDRKLDPRARVRLFVDVCEALQHAHQRGLIHRDLKPTNILVTHREGRHVPKVIDFGIAKATEQHRAERTVFTELGQFIGTPVYMSPEQAEHGEAEVDTRSDIYSLGVVLYELLAGRPPFEAKDLRNRGLAEIQTFIREYEPPPPSTRFTRLGADCDEIARARSLMTGEVAQRLRGDLDWIVMMALEKEPARRYESAASMARDLERYLENLPVFASPPSAVYRMRKFVRRHRLAVSAGAMVLATLVVGAAATVIGFVEARANLAIVNEQAALLGVVLLANSEERELRQGADAADLNARFVAAFGADHPGYPSVLRIEAERLEDQGRASEAIAAYRRAVEVAAKIHGEVSPGFVGLQAQFGRVLVRNRLFDEARPVLLASLALEVPAYGRRTASMNSTRRALAEAMVEAGAIDDALALDEEVLTVIKDEAPDDRVLFMQAATIYLNRGTQYGRLERVAPVWLQLLPAIDAQYPAGTTQSGDVRLQLASWNEQAQVFGRAQILRVLREALACYDAVPGGAPRQRSAARSYLATKLLERPVADDESAAGFALDAATTEEALYLSAGAIDDLRKTSPEARSLAEALAGHAERLEVYGRYADAIQAQLEALDLWRAILGPGAELTKQREALERVVRALLFDTELAVGHIDFGVGIKALERLRQEFPDAQFAGMYENLEESMQLRAGNPIPIFQRFGAGLRGGRPGTEARHPHNLASMALGLYSTGQRARALQTLREAQSLARRPEFTNDAMSQQWVMLVGNMIGASSAE